MPEPMHGGPAPVWTTAVVKDRNLSVGLDRSVDDNWLYEAQETSRRWQGEVRGQTWEDVSFSEHAVEVIGLDEDTSPDNLHHYLAELVEAIEVAVAQVARLHAKAHGPVLARDPSQASADERLTERFRGLSS
jgi:hypothetical protein